MLFMEQPTAMAEAAPATQTADAGAEMPEVRTVDNVAVLKALADPTRLAILAALMRTRDLPVMSVKELAAELGEPQTKLYRHVRQLEAAGLIKVASTRMVSGILEQRYQACQQDLRFGRGFVAEHIDESEAAMQVALDLYRDSFFGALRALAGLGRCTAGGVLPQAAAVHVRPEGVPGQGGRAENQDR